MAGTVVTEAMKAGLERAPGSPVRISEHFDWYEATDEIVDRRTGDRRAATDLDAAVDVYADRQEAWFLHPLDRFTAPRVACPEDYIVTGTLLTYFEGVEQFRQGCETPDRKAGQWFKASAARVLGLKPKDDVVRRLYEDTRCGLFHAGFTYSRVYVAHELRRAVEIGVDGYLRIDPHLLQRAVVADHVAYVAELRNPMNMKARGAFHQLWKDRWKDS